MEQTITVEWIDRGREPQCPPDPNFPRGRDCDVSNGVNPSCKTDLPYPAKRCGYYFLKCDTCGQTALITTAGRPDDPRSFRMPCKLVKPGN